MTGLEAYLALKFWLPIITAFGMVIKAWRSAKKGIGTWADSLLNNHLHGLQETGEKTVALLTEVRDDNRLAAVAVAAVKDDLKAYAVSTEAGQREMLIALEILKDRG